jgi:hypothetical protein
VLKDPDSVVQRGIAPTEIDASVSALERAIEAS